MDARRKKLMKRIMATPMPKHYYLLSFLLWRMILLPVDVGVPLGFGAGCSAFPCEGLSWRWWELRAGDACLQRGGTLDRIARADHRGGIRPDEPHHGAHVDLLGRVLFLAAVSGLVQP